MSEPSGMERRFPRFVTHTNEFAGLINGYIEKNHGGDIRRCFDAHARDGKITRGVVLMIAEEADPKFVAKKWAMVAHTIDSLDTDDDGFIDYAEFSKLCQSQS